MSLPLGFQYLYEIDITPNEAAETWARLGAGLISASEANNETVSDDTYLDDDGASSSDVTGVQSQVDFAGHREVDDIAQNYIDAIQPNLGEGRKTSFRATDPQGNYKVANVSITDINMNGGDANSKRDVSFSVKFNGKAVKTAKQAAAALTATVAGGSASGTTSFTATPDAGNSLSYQLLGATAGTIYGNSYPTASLIGYTTGADIPATAGQFLVMYELSAYGRVAKVLEQELLAGDITA